MKDVYEGDPEPLVLVVLTMATQRYNIAHTLIYIYIYYNIYIINISARMIMIYYFYINI